MIEFLKKAQFFLVGVMFFVMIFIAVVIMIQPLKQSIDESRNSDNLNCTENPSTLTTSVRATCIVTDMSLFYFIGVGLAVAGAFLAGKRLGK